MKQKNVSLIAGAAICTLTVLFTVLYAVLSGMFKKTEAAYTPPSDIDTYAKDAILAVTKAGLMKTTAVGDKLLFLPEKEVTRGEMAEVLARLLSLDTAKYETTPLDFTDEGTIPKATLPAIRAVLARGYMKLHHDHTFRHDDILTREETADIFGGLYKGEISAGKSESFTDFDNVSSHFLHNAEKTADLSLMIGYPDGTFRPKDPLTREELALILYRYIQTQT